MPLLIDFAMCARNRDETCSCNLWPLPAAAAAVGGCNWTYVNVSCVLQRAWTCGGQIDMIMDTMAKHELATCVFASLLAAVPIPNTPSLLPSSEYCCSCCSFNNSKCSCFFPLYLPPPLSLCFAVCLTARAHYVYATFWHYVYATRQTET